MFALAKEIASAVVAAFAAVGTYLYYNYYTEQQVAKSQEKQQEKEKEKERLTRLRDGYVKIRDITTYMKNKLNVSNRLSENKINEFKSKSETLKTTISDLWDNFKGLETHPTYNKELRRRTKDKIEFQFEIHSDNIDSQTQLEPAVTKGFQNLFSAMITHFDDMIKELDGNIAQGTNFRERNTKQAIFEASLAILLINGYLIMCCCPASIETLLTKKIRETLELYKDLRDLSTELFTMAEQFLQLIS